MRVLELPSYSEQLELLPLRYSEPFVNAKRRRPDPRDLAGIPRPRRNPVNEPRLQRRSWRDARRAYMRDYMRRRRQAIA